jgi:hypothetical protein
MAKEKDKQGVTRRAFLKVSGPVTAGALSLSTSSMKNVVAGQKQSEGFPKYGMQNKQFSLGLSADESLQVLLKHLPSGIELASGAYHFSFGTPKLGSPVKMEESNAEVLTIKGSIREAISFKHEFRLPFSQPWFEENFTITNRSSYPLDLSQMRGGFVLPVPFEAGKVSGPLKDFKFTAVPYRREPTGDRKQYADYTLTQVLTEPRSSRLRSDFPIRRDGTVVMTTAYETGIPKIEFMLYASEGWVLTDGKKGFLVTKYNQRGMEWSLLNRVPVAANQSGLCWGGFGIFEGDPQPVTILTPGQTYSFGVSRFTPFEGGLEQGFYLFRAEMDSRGHGCPKGFDPPLQWNELYDNKLYHLGMIEMDKPENRRKYYQLSDMLEEAKKAREYSCEALYCDPGWDTSFASKIWDQSRLGSLKDFSERLRADYGLKLSLHTPMSGWCNPVSYSMEATRMDRQGNRVPFSLCAASKQFQDETLSRLETLARDGATFFMFDGTMYHGECWDPAHGHPVPARREDHVQGNLRLARGVHANYPKVLIEMHDPVLGGARLRYAPTYYGHGPDPSAGSTPSPAGFDSVWAFELMWDPMADLVGGHSIALYYYNLAYSLPLYIHIDLRTDNAQALMFWWNASTCRHLGIGGTHPDPNVQKAHQAAAAAYRRLKPFFASGIFYGIDELTHLHRHPTERSAVINCFNLEDQPVTRRFLLDPARFELDSGATYQVSGGNAQRKNGRYEIEVSIASYGHTLIELKS